MKLQTSCSLHLIFSEPADISEVAMCLIGFLGDQGVHDQKFLDEFKPAATEAINDAIEHGCTGRGDRFAEVTLTVSSVEVQLEIVNPSDLDGWSGEAALLEDPPADRNSLVDRMTTGMEEVPRDRMHILTLRKSLGQLSWNYEPGFQERLLNSMSEKLPNAGEGVDHLVAGAYRDEYTACATR